MSIWVIVSLVLIVMSFILAVMDRSFLSPTYLLWLAIALLIATATKWPW